ncbi:MAG: SAM-dependent methyltransferase [Bacteroidia bacterium]|nr:SAM-dependent methyltransferase [Bacteroidia bacterium]MDW8236557.1 SAM-dependent methyltransferase [Bacteroidia bacterium]
MQLYVIPAPLSRETPYWVYPALLPTLSPLKHFFVEKTARSRSWLAQLGLSLEGVTLYEYQAQLQDWPEEAYQATFGAGVPIGLLSEAGLAGVADPGASVVLRAHSMGYTVIPLAGPSSITLALAGSGMRGDAFTFWGYPPLDKKQRRSFLQQVCHQAKVHTQILMESPARNTSLLQELISLAPVGLLLCVAHHLTAEQGFIRTQPVSAWQGYTLPKAPTLFLLGR